MSNKQDIRETRRIKNYFKGVVTLGVALGVLMFFTAAQPAHAQDIPDLKDYVLTFRYNCRLGVACSDAEARLDILRSVGSGVYEGELYIIHDASRVPVHLVITAVTDPHTGSVMTHTVTIAYVAPVAGRSRYFDGVLKVNGSYGCAFIAGSYYDINDTGFLPLWYGPYPFYASGGSAPQ